MFVFSRAPSCIFTKSSSKLSEDYSCVQFVFFEQFFVLQVGLPLLHFLLHYTAQKVSKYEVFSGPYFPVFSPNTEKYGPEKTPYMDTFHAVLLEIINTRHMPTVSVN